MDQFFGEWPVDSEGVWRQYFDPPYPKPSLGNPILFLDRDGVIVEEVNYLHRVADVRVCPGVVGLVAEANGRGWHVVVVTNQAGVGRGYYGWPEFDSVNTRILALLAEGGARVDAVLAAPHHSDGIGAFRFSDHPMRKPRPGMFLDAIRHFRCEAAECLVVGDRTSDLEAARAAGLRRGVLVQTGYGASEVAAAQALVSANFSVTVLESLADFSFGWFDRGKQI
jgi:D-glycero-D-manno-heptose 1,7-bisphosphate phosphatase